MKTGRFALPIGIGVPFLAALLLAASRPSHIVPNSPGGITGLTLRDSGAGCSGCHGSQPVAYVVPSISGPPQVAAGAQQTFNMAVQFNAPCGAASVADGGTGACRVGIDLASSDKQGLALNDSGIQIVGNEITHTTGAKTIATGQMGTVTYSFKYTMPNALPGSARTLYGVSRVGYCFCWNWTPNFNVVVPLGASGPASVTITASSTSSLTLSWSGGAAAYQITYKAGATPPTNPNDGIKKPLVFNQTSKEITGLSTSTQYSFSVWAASEQPAGSSPGTQLYSSNYASATGTTQAPPPNTWPLLRTGNMGTARFGHTATLLANGKVLVAGGQDAVNPMQSAELYDPASGTFSSTGSMSVARSGHTATPLPNGKVLITGGSVASAVAELYDPITGTFTNTGMMATTRTGHTATLLNNGKVLIAGGTSSLFAADLYDPSNGTFSPTLNMTAYRFFHTATLLTNGKVLLAGGSATSGGTSVVTAEVYDPAANSFSATGNNLTTARKNHTATAMTSGLVTLVGGIDTSGNSLISTETYDSSSNTFTYSANGGPYATAKHTATLLPSLGIIMITGGRASNGNSLNTMYSEFGSTVTLTEPRAGHTATLLPGGRVLIAGGNNGSDASPNPTASADLYDSDLDVRYPPFSIAGTFYGTGNMTAGRAKHTATLLPNGKVLLAGGENFSDNGPGNGVCPYEWDTAELYDGTFTATGSMAKARSQHTATLLPNGKVLVAGGHSSCSSPEHIASAELYDPNSGTFSTTGSMAVGRLEHTATLLPNGQVLIAGGEGPTFNPVASAELYDPNSGTFSATGSMTVARQRHTATLLPNGKVLIAGGFNGSETVYLAELYDPNSGTFTVSNATVYYQTRRERHTATLLPNGKVLVADGAFTANNATASIASALLYDPATDDYGLTSCCVYQTNVMGQNGGRYDATSTLLPDGRNLMIGGFNEGGWLNTAEVYDPEFGLSFPVHDNLFDTGNLTTARFSHTATLLPDGTVLVTGGVGSGSTYLNSAEWFRLSSRPGFNLPQPVITSAPTSLFLPAAISITGTGLRANWEASSGTSQSSPADLPLLRLQRLDNDQMFFITPSTRSATNFTSTIQSGLADGTYRATILASCVPSAQSLITIRTVPLVGPTSVDAAATSATSVAVNWSAVNGAASYEIIRTEDNVNYFSRGTVGGTNFTDSAQSGKAYLYKVHAVNALGGLGPDSAPDLATTVIFDDDPVVAFVTYAKAVHITQLRTAVNAVRTLASLTGGTFAETINAGSTTIKASHILELRSALTPARSALGLTTVSYTDPSLTSGFPVRAVHINQLRSGVK